MNLYTIDKVMLRTQASEIIEKYILDHNLKVGDRLPSERVLAEMLRVGRNTLREGLRKLELSGVVEVKNGRGAYVAGNIGNAINMQISVARVNFLELLEIRRILEQGMTDLVIRNATEKDLARIEACYAHMTDLATDLAAGGSTRDLETADTEFHRAVYRAAHNKMLYELIHPMADAFHDLWDPNEMQAPDGLMYKALKETIPNHRAYVDAIRHGDAEEAKRRIGEILDKDTEITE